MSLPLENIYRRFLLGIAKEEEEQRAEEAILSGEMDVAEIGSLEEGLIDDYVFGDLSPSEEQAFRAHFLSTEERIRKLAFARALMQYSRQQPSAKPERRGDFLRRTAWQVSFAWRAIGVSAVAISILLACVVGFQQIILQRKTQLAQNAQSEVVRLQSDVADRDSRPRLVPAQEFYFVLPRTERDVLHPTVVHISPQARLVWINLHLMSAPAGTHTVELINANRRLWSQELDASENPTVVLPAYLLTSGRYMIQLDTLPPIQREFRVERD